MKVLFVYVRYCLLFTVLLFNVSCMSYNVQREQYDIEQMNTKIQEFLENNKETTGSPASLDEALSYLAGTYGVPVKIYFEIESYSKDINDASVKNSALMIYNILGVDWIVEVKEKAKATCVYHINNTFSHGSLFNKIVLTDIYSFEIIDNKTTIVVGRNKYSYSFFTSTTNPILPNGRNISSYRFYSKWE